MVRALPSWRRLHGEEGRSAPAMSWRGVAAQASGIGASHEAAGARGEQLGS